MNLQIVTEGLGEEENDALLQWYAAGGSSVKCLGWKEARDENILAVWADWRRLYDAAWVREFLQGRKVRPPIYVVADANVDGILHIKEGFGELVDVLHVIGHPQSWKPLGDSVVLWDPHGEFQPNSVVVGGLPPQIQSVKDISELEECLGDEDSPTAMVAYLKRPDWQALMDLHYWTRLSRPYPRRLFVGEGWVPWLEHWHSFVGMESDRITRPLTAEALGNLKKISRERRMQDKRLQQALSDSSKLATEGKLSSATEKLQELEGALGERVEFWSHLGELQRLEGGDGQLAVTAFEKALQCDPGSREVLLKLVEAQEGVGNSSGALSAMESTLKRYPWNVEARLDFVEFAATHGEGKAAFTELARSLQLSPENPRAHRLKSRFGLGEKTAGDHHPNAPTY